MHHYTSGLTPYGTPHAYRARESVLHMLWEMETWLDTHVRSGSKEKPAAQ